MLMTALRDNPLGVTSGAPRLWWQVPVCEGQGAGDQSEYELELTHDPRGFAQGARTETSGVICSADSVAVAWPFDALQPRSVAYWRVRTRCGAGRMTDWSPSQRVVVGPMTDADWSGASSIWPEVPVPPAYNNAVFSASIQIEQLHASVFIRTSNDLRSGHILRFTAGSPGRLCRYSITDGDCTVVEDKALAVSIPADSAFAVRIEARGATIRTSINGTVVDEATGIADDGGAFGVFTKPDESFRVSDVVITNLDGSVLYANDFSKHDELSWIGATDNHRLLVGPDKAGLLGISDADGPDDWALMRHEFSLPAGSIVGAYLHASAQSPALSRQHVYRVWCNGTHVGVGPSRSAGRPHYQSHDLAGLLRPSAVNALAFQCWTQSGKQLQALLDVHYADGTVVTITTGQDWTARTGSTWLPWAGDLKTPHYFYIAPSEAYDARNEPIGWTNTGYAGKDFAAIVVGVPIVDLAPGASAEIMRVAHQPASLRKTAAGQWLLDTGRELSAGIRLSITAPPGSAGTTIEVRLGEELNDDGSVRYKLRAQTTYREVWTLRDGEQVIEHWGYRTFRWAQLITVPGLDLSGTLTILEQVVPQPTQVGSFTSSNPDLDKVWDLCAYTVAANRQDIHMDTGTRERDAYEGDLVVHGRCEMALSRSYDIVRQTNRFLLRRPAWPTEYRFMTITTAWEEYLETGDPDALRADFDLHAAEQGEQWLDANGLVRKFPGPSSLDNGDIVDWPISQRDGYVFTDVNTVVNSWQYQAFVLLQKAASALGRTADAAHYLALSERMRTSVNAQFYDAQTGSYYDGEGTTHRAQHAALYAASLGIAAYSDLPKIADWLVSDQGNPVRVSVNAAHWLLSALFLGDRADAALEILTSRRPESWLSMMETWGATQTMEGWSPIAKTNTTFSHPWGSAPIDAIARHLLGVRVLEPGATRIEVNPQPGSLAKAQGSVATVRGLVHVDIEQSPRYRVSVTLPGNCSGTLKWPLGGHHPQDFDVTTPRSDAAAARVEKDRLITPLTPGTTTVTARRSEGAKGEDVWKLISNEPMEAKR
jgi:alpha-L-rhamnosidase